MRICTWNVNSVRLRFDAVERLLAEHKPDILCLQEIKVANELFPAEIGRALGYQHQHVHGQKGYHGVAFLSRLPFAKTETRHWCGKEDSRHAWVAVEPGDGGKPVELHNFYVPAGGDEPDPEINEKFAHKLQFLAEMADWFAERRKKANRFILVGDLNVAPLETDVWSHKQLLKVVSHTPVEVEALDKVYASHDWVDAVRHFVPPEEQLFSWWSYRARDWEAADRGRRLDHVWVTPALQGALKSAEVLKPVRGWEQPSDHAPVMVELNL
jgi:exodeoxyribonuclease-3